MENRLTLDQELEKIFKENQQMKEVAYTKYMEQVLQIDDELEKTIKDLVKIKSDKTAEEVLQQL